MSREGAVLLIAAVALLLLAGMGWGWSRRRRRDRALVAPTQVPATANLLLRREALYVATSRHGDPLDRLAIHPLAYRSRATVDVTDAGVALALTGTPTVFIPRERIAGSGRATWTIDRVVEPGGLVYVTWRVDDGLLADTVLRFTDGGDAEFLAATQSFHPSPAPTGDPS